VHGFWLRRPESFKDDRRSDLFIDLMSRRHVMSVGLQENCFSCLDINEVVVGGGKRANLQVSNGYINSTAQDQGYGHYGAWVLDHAA